MRMKKKSSKVYLLGRNGFKSEIGPTIGTSMMLCVSFIIWGFAERPLDYNFRL